jgi:hypothetical protein
MTSKRSLALRRSFAALAAAALFAACADGGPLDSRSVSPAYSRLPDLGSCTAVQVPAGSKLSFHAYATGVQIYTWTGTSWRFVAPSADLFADAGGNGLIGTHFAGPTWLTVSGSSVVGTVTGRCPSPGTIDWLRLDAVADGPGVFEHTEFIQRLNTTGGTAPTSPGSFVGEEARVPYTAEYYFYRAP